MLLYAPQQASQSKSWRHAVVVLRFDRVTKLGWGKVYFDGKRIAQTQLDGKWSLSISQTQLDGLCSSSIEQTQLDGMCSSSIDQTQLDSLSMRSSSIGQTQLDVVCSSSIDQTQLNGIILNLMVCVVPLSARPNLAVYVVSLSAELNLTLCVVPVSARLNFMVCVDRLLASCHIRRKSSETRHKIGHRGCCIFIQYLDMSSTFLDDIIKLGRLRSFPLIFSKWQPMLISK